MAKIATVKLDYPVQLPDRTLTEVTIRRPLLKDILKHQSDNMTLAESRDFIADLCGLLPEELELFDIADFERLQDKFLSFRAVSR